MSDVIVGRPPEPSAWVEPPAPKELLVLDGLEDLGGEPELDPKELPKATVTISWLDTQLEQAWVGLFAPGKCWLANLTQANAGLVTGIVTGDHAVTLTVELPALANWERDDAYCLQRQEEIWHFSNRKVAESQLDGDDFLFGWTVAGVWGVLLSPASADPIWSAMVAPFEAQESTPKDAQGLYEIKRMAGGELLSIEPADPTVKTKEVALTKEGAASVLAISIGGGGDGAAKTAQQLAAENPAADPVPPFEGDDYLKNCDLAIQEAEMLLEAAKGAPDRSTLVSLRNRILAGGGAKADLFGTLSTNPRTSAVDIASHGFSADEARALEASRDRVRIAALALVR